MFGIGCFNPSSIIYVGILILILGAMIYYCNMRFQMIETAVMKQNAVLSSFIVNIQREIQTGGTMRGQTQEINCNSAATPEACTAAAAHLSNSQNAICRKIEVSDDSESEDDSESDEDSDSDNDNDNGTERENKGEGNKPLNDKLNIKEIIFEPVVINIGEQLTDINSSTIPFVNNIKIIDLEYIDTSKTTAQEKDVSSASESSSEEDEDEDEEEEVASAADDEIKINKMYSKPTPIKKMKTVPATENKTFETMKVEDLRKLALEKSLATKEDLKKLKKADLIVMLNKYKA